MSSPLSVEAGPFTLGVREQREPRRRLLARVLGGTPSHRPATPRRPVPPPAEAIALASQQAALLRVATAVASGAAPEDVYRLVGQEAAGILGVEIGAVVRFDSDGFGTLVGQWPPELNGASGERTISLEGGSATALVARTGQPARVADAGVAVPVLVGGRLWGALKVATTRPEGLPPNAERELSRFAELIGLAIANAATRDELASLALTDHLTGLANRRAFDLQLGQEIERARRHLRSLSLVILDLDLFKSVNDEHGHDVGDRVLAETARRLAICARAEDTVSRLGGEEFAWILPECRDAGAYAAGERARRAIQADPFPTAGQLTTSCGIAILGENDDLESLLRRADAALYRAKSEGRNRTVIL